ncbi:hypothetical protein QE152_g8110 [Popillia japonica]|uniref:Uncharacterized protein n=1 Tax=Popillia japonica TaxID=7064 RepID=A0AAW1MD71_POPJA
MTRLQRRPKSLFRGTAAVSRRVVRALGKAPRESAPYSRTHHSHARFARELNSCPLEHGGVPSTVDYSAVVLYRIGDLFARYVHLVSVIDIPWVCSLIYYPEWGYVGVLPTFKGSNFINCSLK